MSYRQSEHPQFVYEKNESGENEYDCETLAFCHSDLCHLLQVDYRFIALIMLFIAIKFLIGKYVLGGLIALYSFQLVREFVSEESSE